MNCVFWTINFETYFSLANIIVIPFTGDTDNTSVADHSTGTLDKVKENVLYWPFLKKLCSGNKAYVWSFITQGNEITNNNIRRNEIVILQRVSNKLIVYNLNFLTIFNFYHLYFILFHLYFVYICLYFTFLFNIILFGCPYNFFVLSLSISFSYCFKKIQMK